VVSDKKIFKISANENTLWTLAAMLSDLRPIAILTEEIAIEVTGVVGVSPALWYFRYIASIFLTLHKRLWLDVASLNLQSRDQNLI
jgi:hypothetical protein